MHEVGVSTTTSPSSSSPSQSPSPPPHTKSRAGESGGHWPTLFLIGAQKSATSSLFATLTKHKQLLSPTRAYNNNKEAHFFCHDGGNVSEYMLLFPHPAPRRGMDGTPEYLYDASYVVPRMLNVGVVQAATRFIAILREPVARDWSMFRMLSGYFWPSWPTVLVSDGLGSSVRCNAFKAGSVHSFEKLCRPHDVPLNASYSHYALRRIAAEAVQPGSTALQVGVYHRQLMHYQNAFGPEKVLAIKYEWFRNGASFPWCMSVISRFLDLSDHVWATSDAAAEANVAEREKRAPPYDRGATLRYFLSVPCKALEDFYSVPNMRLQVMLNARGSRHQPRFTAFDPPCTTRTFNGFEAPTATARARALSQASETQTTRTFNGFEGT